MSQTTQMPEAVRQISDVMTLATVAARAKNNLSGKILTHNDPWSCMGEFLNEVMVSAFTHRQDPRLLASLGSDEGIPSEGGFLVPGEQASILLRRIYNDGEITRRCDGIPMGRSRLAIPGISESGRTAATRYGGVQVYRTIESAPTAPSVTKANSYEFAARKLTAILWLTSELKDDMDEQTFDAWAVQSVSRAMGWQMEDECLNGMGTQGFLGALQAPSLVVVAKDSGQAAATISTTNVENMWSQMWGPSQKNAAWFINQDAQPQLLQLSRAIAGAAATEALLKFPDGGGYPTMLGAPVIPVEHCAPLGTTGDIVLADWSEYLVAHRQPLTTRSSIHVSFSTDELAFRFTMRNDGAPKWNAPIAPVGSTIPRSPFVALAPR